MGRRGDGSNDLRSTAVKQREDVEMERYREAQDAHGTADRIYAAIAKHTTEQQRRSIMIDLLTISDPSHRDIISRLVAVHNAGVRGEPITTQSRIFTRVAKIKPGPRPKAKKTNASPKTGVA